MLRSAKNLDVWLDVRYVLKAYLKSLIDAAENPQPMIIDAPWALKRQNKAQPKLSRPDN